MKRYEPKIYLLLTVLMCVCFIACTDQNKPAMEEYLKAIELVNKADKENEFQEKLRLLTESAERFKQVTKQYPKSAATEQILGVASSPYNLYFINKSIKELTASNTQVLVNSDLTTSTKTATLNSLLFKLKDWLQTNDLCLLSLNDYGEVPPIAEAICEQYSALNIGKDQYSKYVGEGFDLAERLLFFDEHQYDISMLKTPKSWSRQGIVIQTKSATTIPELWFLDEKSLEVTHIKANNEGRAGIMSFYKAKDCPETIQIQIYFEACNPYYYISEVRSEIVQVIMSSLSDSDQEFAYFDDDYKILAQDETWTTYQRIFPKGVFSWSDGKPLIYHELTAVFEKAGYCWANKLNVREQGGENYKNHKVLFHLNKGDRVIVLQKHNNWCEIQIPHNPASIGWVIDDYLKHVPPLELTDAEKDNRLIQLKKQAQKLFVELGELKSAMRHLGVMAQSKEILDTTTELISSLNSEFVKNVLPIATLERFDCDLEVISGKEKLLKTYLEAISNLRKKCSKMSEVLKNKLQVKMANEYSNKLESQVFANINSLYFKTLQVINAKIIYLERRNLITKAEAIGSSLHYIKDDVRRNEAEKFLVEYKRIMNESYSYSIKRISAINTAYNRLNYYLQGN